MCAATQLDLGNSLRRWALCLISLCVFVPLGRQYFSDVIADAMVEMQDSGSFTSLLEALGKERDSKMNFHDVITRSGW